MKYQNRVASAIKPEIFGVPLSEKMPLRFSEQARAQKELLDANIKAVNEHQKALESLLDPLSTEHDVDVKYRLEILLSFPYPVRD